MPTYEYACAACGHEWEQIQRITAAPVELCPKCNQSSAHRLISGGTNFILKGGGWYSDLYASPKAPAKKSEEGGAAASSSADTSGKSAEGAAAPTTAADGKAAAPPAASKPSTPASPATPPSASG